MVRLLDVSLTLVHPSPNEEDPPGGSETPLFALFFAAGLWFDGGQKVSDALAGPTVVVLPMKKRKLSSGDSR